MGKGPQPGRKWVGNGRRARARENRRRFKARLLKARVIIRVEVRVTVREG